MASGKLIDTELNNKNSYYRSEGDILEFTVKAGDHSVVVSKKK